MQASQRNRTIAMKFLVKATIAGMAASLLLSHPRICAELEVGASISIQTATEFEAPLTPLGTWVDWRVGGGYCGWAPRHPRGIVASPNFVFVETRHFHEPVRPTTVIIHNPQIVQRTAVIGGPVQETRNVSEGGRPQRVVVNRGPDVALVERDSGTRFVAVPVRVQARSADPPASIRRRDNLPERRTAPLSPDGSAAPQAPARAVPTQPQVDRPVREPVTPNRPETTPAPAPAPAPVPAPAPRRDVPHRDVPPREMERPLPPIAPGAGRTVPPQAAPISPELGSPVGPPPRPVPQPPPSSSGPRQGKLPP